MNIKQLKELIKSLPDDAPVVCTTRDHGMRYVRGEIGNVLYNRVADEITEDFGEDVTPAVTYGKRIKALVLS